MNSSDKPTTRRVEAHGLGIHVREWPGKPPAVVMLHALGFTGVLYEPLAQTLSQNHQVVCPDIRGHGRTDRPPEGYQYPNLVRDLEGMLQMLRINKLVLVGHTWGADVAMTFAAKHPKRLHGLVLIDGGYRYRREIPGNEKPHTLDRVKSSAAFLSMEAAIEDAKQQLDIPWSPALQRAIEDSLEIGRDGGICYRLDDHRWNQIYKALWEYDPSPLLAGVQVPTLLVHPEGPDPSSPEGSVAAFQARAATLLMKDARLLQLPETNNLSLLSSSKLAQVMNEFIDSVSRP